MKRQALHSNSRELLRRILAATRIHNAAYAKLSSLGRCVDALRCVGVMEGSTYAKHSEAARLYAVSGHALKALRAAQIARDGVKFNAKRKPRIAIEG